jgi:hypothetical protein
MLIFIFHREDYGRHSNGGGEGSSDVDNLEGVRYEDLRYVDNPCDERHCGDSVHSDDSEAVSDAVVVKQSGIRNAGCGLFAKREIREGEVIGYMGGILRCCVCVKGKKLTRNEHRYSTIECGVLMNDADEEVLWYLTRNGGILWYMNSSRSRCRQREYRTANCLFVFEGFDTADMPIVSVRARQCIRRDSELLVDYMI